MYALVAIGLILAARTAIVRAPRGAAPVANDAVRDRGDLVSSPMRGGPAPAPRDGLFPCITWIASHPVVPGRPAVSRAPDGTTFDSFHAYFPSDIYAAYGVDQLHTEGLTGQGQTIVIVDSYGSPRALQDLQTFSNFFGLPAPDLTIIYPDGKPTFNNAMHGIQVNWAVETSLDLQWAHAIAPDAKLVLIAANPAETQGVQGLPSMFKGIAYAVANYPGSVISQSFGVTEQSFQSAADTQVAKFDQVYQQAIAARCTLLASSGDNGTANTDKQMRVYPFPTVIWPASDPLVTACGGTWLQWNWLWNPTDADPLNYQTVPGRTEPLWNEFYLPAATGGGLSALYPTPGFQSGLPAGLLNGRRGVPDISWNAAVNGGVLVYMSPPASPFPDAGFLLVGGTSAASPQLAGLIALTNQLRQKHGKQPIGYLNPILYGLPAGDFNDTLPQIFGTVSLDDNLEAGSGIPGFNTTPGWDLTTGFGSPKACQFVHDLAKTP
jgi:subtilase family serine protease